MHYSPSTDNMRVVLPTEEAHLSFGVQCFMRCHYVDVVDPSAVQVAALNLQLAPLPADRVGVIASGSEPHLKTPGWSFWRGQLPRKLSRAHHGHFISKKYEVWSQGWTISTRHFFHLGNARGLEVTSWEPGQSQTSLWLRLTLHYTLLYSLSPPPPSESLLTVFTDEREGIEFSLFTIASDYNSPGPQPPFLPGYPSSLHVLDCSPVTPPDSLTFPFHHLFFFFFNFLSLN